MTLLHYSTLSRKLFNNEILENRDKTLFYLWCSFFFIWVVQSIRTLSSASSWLVSFPNERLSSPGFRGTSTLCFHGILAQKYHWLRWSWSMHFKRTLKRLTGCRASKRGWKGFLRDTGLSVFNFWSWKVKTRNWNSWTVNGLLVVIRDL